MAGLLANVRPPGAHMEGGIARPRAAPTLSRTAVPASHLPRLMDLSLQLQPLGFDRRRLTSTVAASSKIGGPAGTGLPFPRRWGCSHLSHRVWAESEDGSSMQRIARPPRTPSWLLRSFIKSRKQGVALSTSLDAPHQKSPRSGRSRKAGGEGWSGVKGKARISV